MDLLRALSDFPELQTQAWHEQLQFASKTKADSADFDSLKRFCKVWCRLSDWLNTNRPEKLRVKLLFTVGEHETDSYWFHLVYCSNKLGTATLDRIAQKLLLRDTVSGAALSNAVLNDSDLCDLIEDTYHTLGVLYYCSTTAFRCSQWVEKMIPECCDNIIELQRSV